MTTPITVTSLILPTTPNAKGLRDTWVSILRPRHTFFAASTEDLDEAVAHEVKRLCNAQELSPLGYLALLPLRDEILIPLHVSFERGLTDATARLVDGKKRVADQEAKKLAVQVLDSIADPLHTAVGLGARPFPLRDAERELLGMNELAAGDRFAMESIARRERLGLVLGGRRERFFGCRP